MLFVTTHVFAITTGVTASYQHYKFLPHTLPTEKSQHFDKWDSVQGCTHEDVSYGQHHT